jgi:hypothetical protein
MSLYLIDVFVPKDNSKELKALIVSLELLMMGIEVPETC